MASIYVSVYESIHPPVSFVFGYPHQPMYPTPTKTPEGHFWDLYACLFGETLTTDTKVFAVEVVRERLAIAGHRQTWFARNEHFNALRSLLRQRQSCEKAILAMGPKGKSLIPSMERVNDAKLQKVMSNIAEKLGIEYPRYG